jgi:hypothetical protein
MSAKRLKEKKHNEPEAERRENAILGRLLATPPQPKTKKKEGASPKKRGRPSVKRTAK